MAVFVRATATKYLFINNYCNKVTIKNGKPRNFCGFSRLGTLLRHCRSNIPIVANFSETNQSSNSSNISQNDITEQKVKTFDELLSFRRCQAKCSVIIQVQSPESYADLYSYCHKFGKIKSVHHYVVSQKTYFFIVEFNEISSMKTLINSSTHLNHNEIIPVQSQMMWFRNIPKTKQKQKKNLENLPELFKCKKKPTKETITAALSEINSVSEQMKILYELCQLDDTETRLRFLTALQMESSYSSLFPNITVLPFGSSVNGFGKSGCDLDLVLNLEPNKNEKVSSRLVFHTKSAMSEERAHTQRSMEAFSTIMQYFVPGVVNVRKILHARVPIIKYDHTLTGLECDLSMTNMTAVYMSELLYLFGEIHSSVRPLVFTIRHWASSVGITSSHPGPWITNFSLSLLVLFFFQHKKILPSINSLKKLAQNSDVRITDTCVDCTFVRDVTQWPVPKNSDESLDMLLLEFYHFYANFDFTTRAISLREGESLYKPDSSPLFIYNPLEKKLNVSKNVTVTEVTRFINSVRNAAMLMDEGENSHGRGLLDILVEKQPRQKSFVIGRPRQTLAIADLFQPQNKSNDEIIRSNKKQYARRR